MRASLIPHTFSVLNYVFIKLLLLKYVVTKYLQEELYKLVEITGNFTD